MVLNSGWGAELRKRRLWSATCQICVREQKKKPVKLGGFKVKRVGVGRRIQPFGCFALTNVEAPLRIKKMRRFVSGVLSSYQKRSLSHRSLRFFSSTTSLPNSDSPSPSSSSSAAMPTPVTLETINPKVWFFFFFFFDYIASGVLFLWFCNWVCFFFFSFSLISSLFYWVFGLCLCLF